MTTHEQVPAAFAILPGASPGLPPGPARSCSPCHRGGACGPFAGRVFWRLARVLVAAAIVSTLTVAALAQPTDSDPRLLQAAQLLEQGALSEAISLLEAVLDTRPRDVDVLLMLGSALSMVPRRNEALTALLRAIELSPEDGRVHGSAGIALARLGEQDAALRVFERALALDPELEGAHLNLALVLAARGQFDRAAEHMAKALSLEVDQGKLARLHFLNGKLYIERDRLEEAGREFERSIALDSRNADAHLSLGLVQKRLLREDESYPMFQRAVELAPENPSARYQLALELQRRGDYDAAAEHFRSVHEMQPDDRSVVYNLSRVLHKVGRLSESRHYREILAQMIESGDRARENELETARLHGEAVRLEEVGRYAEALDRYRAVLQIEPLNAVPRRNLALVLCRLGRWDEGIEELEAMLRDNPDDAETARVLAIVLDQAREARAGSP